MTSIRNWLKIPKISTMYGAYRRTSIKDTKVIPHSFTFLRRDCSLPAFNSSKCFFEYNRESVLVTRIGPMALGMPSSLLDIAVVRMPSWYEASPNDVFCLVKAFVSDNELSQPPLLVLPGSQKQNLYDSLCRLALPTAECASPQLHDVPRLCDLKLIHLDV